MAVPVVESVTNTTNTSPGTTMTITLDDADSAGELLVVIVTTMEASAGALSPGSSGLTEILENEESSLAGAWVGYKEASGSEGTSLAISRSSAATAWVAQVYRISNWDSNNAPEVQNTGDEGVNDTPDPPLITATWDPDDTLFIAVAHAADDAATVDGYPSGYTSTTAAIADGGINSSCTQGSGYKTLTGDGSDNPGTFTLSENERTKASTIAVLGGAGGGGGPATFRGLTLLGVGN